MTPHLLYLIGGLCFVIGSALQLGQRVVDDDSNDDAEPWGFNVTDGGTCDGGNYEGWEE